MDRQAANTYVFSTPAYWNIKGLQLPGTLGLTASGRVEFSLDDGRQILSAPVALTKRYYIATTALVGLAVESHEYLFQFYKRKPAYTLTEPANVRASKQYRPAVAMYKNWREKLDQAAQQPADNLPAVTATLPDDYESQVAAYRQDQRQRMMRTLIIIAVGGCVLLCAALAFALSRG
ncbi:MAG TPA: hypothetical protein VLF91_00625 [Candidatus Saccharimonadales bacterium]|nr:hypothetical protein [Candidatus Saccharimonadales bacterium]